MKTELVIMGDSHCIPVIHWLKKEQQWLSIYGNQLPFGANWQSSFHNDITPLFFSKIEAQKKFEEYIAPYNASITSVMELNIPLILSLSSLHSVIYHWDWNHFSIWEEENKRVISKQLFETILESHYSHIFRFFEYVKGSNPQVYNLICPGPRNNENRRGHLHLAVRAFMLRRMKEIGVHCFDVTQKCSDGDGVLLSEFHSEQLGDRIHGNHAWGSLLANEIMEYFSIKQH